MNDETRRTQILEAEESIRQMVEHIGRAQLAADDSEAVNGKLNEALETLKGTSSDLQTLSEKFQSAALEITKISGDEHQESAKSLNDAKSELEKAAGGLSQAEKSLNDVRASLTTWTEEQTRVSGQQIDGVLVKLESTATSIVERTGESINEVQASLRACAEEQTSLTRRQIDGVVAKLESTATGIVGRTEESLSETSRQLSGEVEKAALAQGRAVAGLRGLVFLAIGAAVLSFLTSAIILIVELTRG